MRTLYVTEDQARLQKCGERLEVRAQEVLLESVRLDELSQLVVMSSAGISTPLVRALMARGVDVVFVSRQGAFLGRLSCGLSKNVFLRKSQYAFFQEEKNQLELARRLVAGKLENQRRLLLRAQRRHPDDQVAVACAKIRHLLAEVPQADNLDKLRGLEGAGSREYFGVFGRLLLGDEITFTRRLRRPPPDPVNVLLSFGYTLLGNLLQGQVEASGLDPYLGCLHELRYGRPSLVLDLMEEFRPVVDGVVLQAVNSRAVMARDFAYTSAEQDEAEQELERREFELAEAEGRLEEPPRRPIIFLRSGVKKWLAVWARRLEQRVHYGPRGLRLTLREVMREQVYRLCEHLQGVASYEPFLLPV